MTRSEPPDRLPEPMRDERDALRHLLASLVFRFRNATDDAPEGFATFDPGAGVRAPGAIVRHLASLLRLASEVFDDPAAHPAPPSDAADDADGAEDWAATRRRFLTLTASLDAHLASGTAPRDDARLDLGQALRGPLCDALTHVGQLATLRRLAGAPVARARFWKVAMPAASGDAGPEAPGAGADGAA